MLTIFSIVAPEVGVPVGAKPIEWRLLTNRITISAAEVAELINWYRARWEIEMLFNVLKNGYKVEELQLGTVGRIERALAQYLVVARRIAHLMRIGRICPALNAKLFFDPDGVQAAYLLNRKLAPNAPKLSDVLRTISRAVGFRDRKGDGEPGAKTIWERLRDASASAHTIKTHAKWECCRVAYNRAGLSKSGDAYRVFDANRIVSA